MNSVLPRLWKMLLLSCALLFFPFSAFPQLDSLQQRVENAQSTEDRLKAQIDLIVFLDDKEGEAELIDEVIETAKKEGLPYFEFQGRIQKIQLLENNSEQIEAFEKLLEEAQSRKVEKIYPEIYVNYSRSLMKAGKYEMAVENAFSALEASRKVDEEHQKLRAFDLLGRSYFLLGQLDKSKTYFKKRLEAHLEGKDYESLVSAYNNLGIIYKSETKYDSAMIYYEKARELNRDLKNDAAQAQCNINIGILYYQQDSSRKGLDYLYEALELSEPLDNKELDVKILTNLGLVHLDLKNAAEASEFARRAMKVAREINYPKAVEYHYYILSEAAKIDGDYESALEYFENYKAIEDSLVNAEKEARIAELEEKYETTQLKRENLESEKQKERAEAGMKISILVAILLAVVVLAFVFLFQRNRIKSDYKEMELKQKALRAQINPHFLFNALNSIQASIMTDDKKVAISYHSKFARLMRLVLSNSENPSIPLKKELELLSLYIDLEKMRSDDFFETEIEVSKSIEPEAELFPSMVLQPVVENAIWHGLMNRKTPGRLTIKVEGDEKRIVCKVIDNGVGREAAQKIDREKVKNHRSFGLEATRRRLDLYSKLKKVSTSFEIHDLNDQEGQPAGTMVELIVGRAK
ncbi:tetratricopeptide repeat-containing sensor histidine kinase [Halocola ammonii]